MSSARALLLGQKRDRSRPTLRRLAPPACFVLVFAAYAVGVFEVAGGVVFLAGNAAAVGSLAAAALAVRRNGLILSWTVVYAALLGYSADHYLLGLSGRSVGDRLVALLGVDGLVYLGVQALVIGTLAWLAGRLVRLAGAALSRRCGVSRRDG